MVPNDHRGTLIVRFQLKYEFLLEQSAAQGQHLVSGPTQLLALTGGIMKLPPPQTTAVPDLPNAIQKSGDHVFEVQESSHIAAECQEVNSI